MNCEVPVNEWLLCWNEDASDNGFNPKETGNCPFFFVYLDEDGKWMSQLDESCNWELPEAPKNWMTIPYKHHKRFEGTCND